MKSQYWALRRQYCNVKKSSFHKVKTCVGLFSSYFSILVITQFLYTLSDYKICWSQRKPIDTHMLTCKSLNLGTRMWIWRLTQFNKYIKGRISPFILELCLIYCHTSFLLVSTAFLNSYRALLLLIICNVLSSFLFFFI